MFVCVCVCVCVFVLTGLVIVCHIVAGVLHLILAFQARLPTLLVLIRPTIAGPPDGQVDNTTYKCTAWRATLWRLAALMPL